MVEESARRITDSLIAEGLIAKNLKEWYVYSFIRIIEMTINVGTILLLSIIFQNTVPTILFLLFFNILRQRTGGFHCNEFWQCYIVTNMLYALISLLEKNIVIHGVILWIVAALSAAVIFVVGTVNHPNISYDMVELRRSKTLARNILSIELLVLFFMGAIRIDRVYIYYMSVSIVLCAVLILLAKVFRQEVNEDENKKNN